MYQIFREKILLEIVRDIVTIICPTFIFGKKFILKRLPNIWGENSSKSCTRHCYHFVSYVYIWEEIYSEICTNICEEKSSESCTVLLQLCILLYLGRKLFWNLYQYLGRNFFWKLYLILLLLCILLYYLGRFILNIEPMFGEKILLKVVLNIVTTEQVEYPTFISAKKFILKLLLIFLILNVFAKKNFLKLYFVSCYCHGVFYFSKSVI